MLRTWATWGTGLVAAFLLLAGALPLIVLSLGFLRQPVMDRVIACWGGLVLWVAGIELEATGREHLSERKGRVVIMNHSSALDMVVIARLSPPAMMPVFKDSLRWVFPVNVALAMMGVVYVDRRVVGGSVTAMQQIAERLAVDCRALALSPEGTRSRTGRLGPFKSGAFHVAQQAGVEIVPVVIHGAHALCPPTGWRVRSGRVRVDVESPIPAPGPEDDPRAIADTMRSSYLDWLGEVSGG